MKDSKKTVIRDATAGPRRTAAALPCVAAVCVLLVLAIALEFVQTANHGFVNYDDGDYVYNNPQVLVGLTFRGAVDVFSYLYSDNWHPLTWISHMLDCQLYGNWVGGHHLTSVVLHAANSILLLLLLLRLTGELWPSTVVVAIFALHPLRAESVAWVAERKDVLCGLFFMLTVRAYLDFVAKPYAHRRYFTVIVLFALGLMCKPMLVTLPFLLLLLDYWPLQRIGTVIGTVSGTVSSTVRGTVSSTVGSPASPTARRRESARAAPVFANGRFLQIPRASWDLLLAEKVPFFAVAIVSSTITMFAQRGSMSLMPAISLPWRAGNAVAAYSGYLVNFILPTKLAVIYPHEREHLAIWKIGVSAVLIATVTSLAIARRREFPQFFIGWLWYLGMLVPVVGFIQVGWQSMADRYTYLLLIGPTVALTWGVKSLVQTAHGRIAAAFLSGGGIAVLLVGGWNQTSTWHDSQRMWQHTLACTARNYVAEDGLGMALETSSRMEAAIAQYQKTIAIWPDYPGAKGHLCAALAEQGRIDESLGLFANQLPIISTNASIHFRLGRALQQVGRLPEAIVCYKKAIELQEDMAIAHNNLAVVLAQQGDLRGAIAEWQRTLSIDPKHDSARKNIDRANEQLIPPK